LGFYDNSNQALVLGGAQIDATDAVNVQSELSYPLMVDALPFASFNATDPDNGDFIAQLADVLAGSGGATNMMNVWASTKGRVPESELTITGSIAIVDYKNRSEASIGAGAKINQKGVLQGPNQAVKVNASTKMETLNVAGVIQLDFRLENLRNNFNAKDSPISLFANEAGRLGIGGSVLVQTYDNDTIARIAAGALVHTDTAGDGLVVEASEEMWTLDFAQTGGNSGKIGVAGSFSILTQTSETLAQLESGVRITGGDLSLAANNIVNHINLVGAVQLAKQVGIGVSVGSTQVTRNTAAIVGKQKTANDKSVGSAGTVIDVTGLSLSATNSGKVAGVGVAGAVVADVPVVGIVENKNIQPTQIGVGFTGVAEINRITDATSAYVNDDGAITLGGGDLKAGAGNQTGLFALAGAATLVKVPKTAVGIAGAFAYNEMNLSTEASVAGATIRQARASSLSAKREGKLLAITAGIAGAAAVPGPNAPTPGQGGAGAAGGSASVNVVNASNLAFVDGADLIGTGDVTLTATSSSPIQAVSIGGAGAVATGNAAVAIAGAVSVNTITNDTETYIKNSQGAKSVQSTGGNITLDARDTSRIDADGGGFALALLTAGTSGGGGGSGSVSVGFSVAVNTINDTVRSSIVDATVQAAGAVTLNADAKPAIEALTLGGAGAGTAGNTSGFGFTFAGAGVGSGNAVNSTAEAFVERGAVTASNVALSADGGANITADAGGVAIAATLGAGSGGSGTVSIGIAVAINNISNIVRAYGNAASIVANSVSLDAVSTATIDALTIGGAIAVQAGQGAGFNGSGAGSGSGNTITNTVDAYIKGSSTVTANQGTVAIRAKDLSKIRADAGAASIAIGASQQATAIAVGASIASNTVNNKVRAYISGSTVSAPQGDVIVKTTSEAEIRSIALAGSLAFAPAAGALAGSASLNFIGAETDRDVAEAYIDGNSVVSADGNVAVTADGQAALSTLAGGLGAAIGLGFGLANTTLVSYRRVEAYVGANATVITRGNRAGVHVLNGERSGKVINPSDALGRKGNATYLTKTVTGLAVEATSFDDVFTVSVAGALSTLGGVAGSAPVNVLSTTTKAHIDDNAKINFNADGTPLTGTVDNQNVDVAASSVTHITAGGGSLGFGLTAGIGVGATVGVLNKDTQAFISKAAKVTAARDVVVAAQSSEDLFSVSVSAGIGAQAAGVGGSAGVYVMNITTKAFIGGATSGGSTVANGNVVITADDKTKVAGIAGGGAFGAGAGIGAGVMVPVITKTTHAYVDANAVVNAKGQTSARTVRNGEFDVAFTPYSGAQQQGEIRAPQNNQTLSDSGALSGHRLATPKTQSISGLAVVATNQDDIETIAVAGGLAGAVGISVAVGVNVHNTDVQAYIGDGALVNQDPVGNSATQSVLVAAGNDYYHLGVAGTIAGGGGIGAAPGVDVTSLSNKTLAWIGKAAGVQALGDITVRADAQEEILSIAVGLGVGGGAGVAGAVSVLSINNTTYGYLGIGSRVLAGGNLLVAASDDTKADVIDGSLGLGAAFAGVGASVAVTDIKKDTRAFVDQSATAGGSGNSASNLVVYDDLGGQGGATTKSIKGVGILATSSEDLLSVAAAGGGSLAFGLAGGVSVSMVTSNTRAFVGESATVGSSAGSINVSAFNRVKMTGAGGALGIGGGAGIAGGVDVGQVRNDTQAYYGDNSTVNAFGSVNAVALSVKDVTSYGISGGGGLLGLAGAVSVYNIGADFNADGTAALTNANGPDTLISTMTGAISPQRILDRLNFFAQNDTNDSAAQQQTIDTAKSRISTTPDVASDLNNPHVISITQGQVSLANNTIKRSSGSWLTDGFKVGQEITVSGSSVNDGTYRIAAATADTITVVGGGAFKGEPVSSRTIKIEGFTPTGATTARIGFKAKVTAGDDINVEAGLIDSLSAGANAGKQGNFGIGIGLVTLGAQVGIINDNSRQLAYVDQGSNITRADHLNVLASARRDAVANATGVQIGGIAAGASISRINMGGSTIAFAGDSTKSSRPATVRINVNYLNVIADHETTALTEMTQGNGGLLTGQGNDASAIINPVIAAFLDGNTLSTVENTISVTARSAQDADAHAYGVGVAGISVGVSLATAKTNPTVDAFIGKGASATAGQDLIVQAVHNFTVHQDAEGTRRPVTEPTGVQREQKPGTVANRTAQDSNPDNTLGVLRDYGAYATSFASSGSLLGGGDGANATADASAKLNTRIVTGAVLNAGGNVSILSQSLNDAHAMASGVSFGGVIGAGTKRATTTGTGETLTSVDGKISKAIHVDVQAAAVDTGNSITDAIAASVVGAGLGSYSTTTLTPKVSARIGSRSIDPSKTGVVDAAADTVDLGYQHGFSTGQGLYYDNGDPGQKQVFNPTTAGAVAANTIDFGAAHNFANGQAVVYHTGGGTAIGTTGTQRLVDGKTYFVIRVDANKIQLAETAGGPALSLNTTGTTGTQHSFDSNGASLPIQGGRLSNGNLYYVIAVPGSPTKIKLAATQADALAGRSLNLLASDSGSTQHSFTVATPTPYVTATGNVTVVANSVTDGDARADGTSGAALISAGVTNSTTMVTPTVESFIGLNGKITTTGNLIVQARHGTVPADAALSSFTPATAVDGTNGTITFDTNPGFTTGSQVLYNQNGGPSIGGLQSGTPYYVKVIDNQTIRLFETQAESLQAPYVTKVSGGQVSAVGSASLGSGAKVTYRTVPVDFSDSAVGFTFDANGNRQAAPNSIYVPDRDLYGALQSGDRIIYRTNDKPLNGLVNGQTYFVIKNNDGTISLSSTSGGAVIAISATSQHTLGSIAFSSSGVATDDKGSYIQLANLNGVSTGLAVVYDSVDGANQALIGLEEGKTYYVLLDNQKPNAIRLVSEAAFITPDVNGNIPAFDTNGQVKPGAALIFSVPENDHSLTGNGVLNGFQEGGVYIQDSTDPLHIKYTPIGGGAALVFGTGDASVTGKFGFHSFSSTPVDLAGNNAGTHSLYVPLTASASTVKQNLVDQGVSSTLGASGDGISSARSTTASYAGLGAGAGPETRVTVSPTVGAFVDKKTVLSAKDVGITSESAVKLATDDRTDVGGVALTVTNPTAMAPSWARPWATPSSSTAMPPVTAGSSTPRRTTASSSSAWSIRRLHSRRVTAVPTARWIC